MSPEQQFADKYQLALEQVISKLFSYATPVEWTEGAFTRLVEGLESLKR